MGDFRVEDFRLTPEAVESNRATQRTKARKRRNISAGSLASRKRPYISGPIPLDLLQPIFDQRCGLGVMWVALLLWHCRGLYDAPFSNKRLKRFGIDRRMKARALRKLEELGLIAIERRGKRNPRVALLDVGE